MNLFHLINRFDLTGFLAARHKNRQNENNLKNFLHAVTKYLLRYQFIVVRQRKNKLLPSERHSETQPIIFFPVTLTNKNGR